MARVTVTNETLVDTCSFPSERFGTDYTSRLANDVIANVTEGSTITHPADANLTQTNVTRGQTVTNTRVQAIDTGVTSIAFNTRGATVNAATKVTNVTRGATITSDIDSIASDYYVTNTTRGATVTGKSCN